MKEVVWLLLTCFLANVVSTDEDQAVRCFINIKSFSNYIPAPCSKPVEGYVYLNGKVVWEAGWCSSKPNLRGVTTMIVDPFTCTASNIRRFDTYASSEDSNDLVAYLQWVREGALIVGVTGDEPAVNLGPALRTLTAAGVSVRDVKPAGNFAFVLQKGYPEKTQMVKALTRVVPYSLLEVSIHGVSIDKLQITALKKYSVRAANDDHQERGNDE